LPINILKLTLSILIGLILTTIGFAQQNGIISGRIIDKDTKEGVPGASVYLSQTTHGAQSNADGTYSFNFKTAGDYTLVVSVVGYKTIQQKISLESGSTYSFNISITALVVQLETIVVKSSNKEWIKNFESFEKFFIGEDNFASDVVIENPEVLTFKQDPRLKRINVTAVAPLIVRNNALGYMIRIDFVSVYFNPYDKTGLYTMYTNFQDLSSPNSPKQSKAWQKTRKTAYFGSSMHFFRSLLNNTLRKDGFTYLPEGGVIEPFDDMETIVQFYPNNWAAMLSAKYSAFSLSRSPAYVGYQLRINRGKKVENPSAVTSITLQGKTPFVFINASGQVRNPADFLFNGKWSTERVSRLLPSDYDVE
tara:strand:+ start:10568 stop:11659 length:1092 start_codon:yes stop_codon:yes gene_type:complete